MKQNRPTMRNIKTMRNVANSASSPGKTNDKKSYPLELFILENKKERIKRKIDSFQSQLNQAKEELKELNQKEKEIETAVKNSVKKSKDENNSEDQEVYLEY